MEKTNDLLVYADELRNAAQTLLTLADKMTPPSTPQPIKLEQVRAVLAEKSRDGHTAKIRELLEKHGSTKLSEIDPAKYQTLLTEAENLKNE